MRKQLFFLGIQALFVLAFFLTSCIQTNKLPRKYIPAFTPDTISTTLLNGFWLVDSLEGVKSYDCNKSFLRIQGSTIEVRGDSQRTVFSGVFRIKDTVEFEYFYVPYYDDANRYLMKYSKEFVSKYYDLNISNRKNHVDYCETGLIIWMHNIRSYFFDKDLLILSAVDGSKIKLRKMDNASE